MKKTMSLIDIRCVLENHMIQKLKSITDEEIKKLMDSRQAKINLKEQCLGNIS